ncbi:hypothetical protein DNK03_00255 [Brucella anthropi]|uniref:hypothetical protein n=1 Tax=Brucella anthropi TaxID=529 RepID=UPI000DED1C65|nr:hypothetical protein [Brucella anthropi]RCI80069.1 hypothetical protein DNK03_00255 [Brucella anthropi]
MKAGRIAEKNMNRCAATILPLLLLVATPTLGEEGQGEAIAGPIVPEGYVGLESENSEPDTGPLMAALKERFIDRIAGIYIEREPDFHVVVRLTGDRDAGTLQYQLGEDRVRVEVQTGAAHTVDQLLAAFDQRETIARFLPASYGGYVDERAGGLVLTVDIGTEIAVGSEAALSDALGVPVRIIEQERATVRPTPQQREE